MIIKYFLLFILFILTDRPAAFGAGPFSSPRIFWTSCKDEPRTSPKCYPENFQDRLAQMCSENSNKADCAKLSAHFTALARQAEAKAVLTSAYIAQIAIRAEKGSYTHTLKDVYKVSNAEGYFVIAFSPLCEKQFITSADLGQKLPSGFPKSEVIAAFKAHAAKPCADPKSSFQIFAIGAAHPIKRHLDIWAIDEKKNLRQLLSSTASDPFE